MQIGHHRAFTVPTAARLLGAAVLCGGAAACGGSPDAEALRATARSWTATVLLASAERRSGAVSARYATQVGDRASEALTTLRAAEKAPAARAVTDSLERALDVLGAELARP